MGEVVGFRGKGRDRAEAETAEREARRERAAALRAVLDKNEPMNPEDQMLVAEALWRLLERAERQGVRKARVLRAAGIGSEGDSTKHLAQYALDTAWPRERKEKARLTKKPGPYRRITEEAAKLTAGDADEAILEVFGGTSLATSGHVAEAEPEYEVLARTLREVVEAVAAKHGLQDYFQAVARAKPALCVENYGDETNGHKLDPDEIELHFVPAACSLDWPVEFGKAGRFGLLHDGDSSVPPYPAIVLGKPGIGNSSSVRIESDEFPCEGEYGASPFCGKTSISYSAELRLCIVPTGPEMHPTAALRIELDALMYPLQADKQFPGSMDDETKADIVIFSRVGYLPYAEPALVEASVTATNRTIYCRVHSKAEGLPSLLKQYFDLRHTSFFGTASRRFLPITGSVCRDWMSLSPEWQASSFEDEELSSRVLRDPEFELVDGEGFSNFAPGTIAAALDQCLSGQKGPNPVAMLDERAARLVQLLAEAQADAQQARKAGYDKLRTRLRAMHDERG